MKLYHLPFLLLWILLLTFACEEKNNEPENARKLMQLNAARAGTIDLESGETNENVPVDASLVFSFSCKLDTATITPNMVVTNKQGDTLPYRKAFLDAFHTVSLKPANPFKHAATYTVSINKGLKGANGEEFPGISFRFGTRNGTMQLAKLTIDGIDLTQSARIKGVAFEPTIQAVFSESVNTDDVKEAMQLKHGTQTVDCRVESPDADSIVQILPQEKLADYTRYTFSLKEQLTSRDGFSFEGFSNRFYTRLDSTDKFERISDEALLTRVQEQTFRYFWDYAHPTSGLARERYGSGNTVTSGGSGFGIMTIPVGIERGFITRAEGMQRLQKILNFLENAERFHGAWSHWLNGETGEAIAFSAKDNGGDLVETAFLVQGLLTVREYLNPDDPDESAMISQINSLWKGVEWDWYTQDENVLYWHWSPDYGFEMNMQIRGHNETQIVYILAAASPDHGISAETYHQGYARSGAIANGNNYYGHELPLGYGRGGPLFFTHYSYLGLDPRNLQDDYADYWKQNTSHTLINRAYCVENPKNYVGYGKASWGLTASDNHEGYSAHSPGNDLGVITPTAAISSMPYTPEQSMQALRFFYYKLGDRLWGQYGFHDAYSPTHQWYADSYLAIDQGPIILMIENHRTGLLWELFMQAPEVQQALDELGFQY